MNSNELYTLPQRLDSANRADQAFWMRDGVIIFLVIALSLLDAITLYTVFDTVMYQSMLISVVLTVGCAIALNFIPLILARFTHLWRYEMNGVRLWMLIAIAAVFLILFSSTFYLRWETRNLAFGGAESSMVDSTGQAEGIEDTDADSNEAVAITILLGVMPFITSCINYALGYLNDDPVKRKLIKLQRQRTELQDHLNNCRAAATELEQDWLSRLNGVDQMDLAAKEAMIRSSTAEIKALARLKLAEKLGTPNAISQLTENPV